MRTLARAAELVEPAELPHDICRDPTDVAILGTAVAGDADLLVTVDNDLLALGRYAEIAIVRPAEYWNRVTR